MKLSVVMSVYNGAPELARTLDSILAQTERDFELIAIDDGSTDATPQILAAYAARDARIRVITQANSGLTRALIRGCAEARAPIIARHDCGDRSHPERFAKQVTYFDDPEVVLVAAATRYVSPEGDLLYVSRAEGEEIRRSLLNDPAPKVHNVPGHPVVMFRRDAYVAAGGYRQQFRIAQDLDLWVRLARLGRIAVAPEELYEATFHYRAISGVGRDMQVRAAELIMQLRDHEDDPRLLAAAAQLAPRKVTPRREAGGLYFIARCLRAQRNPAARQYLLRAVRRNPLHWRAWLALLTGR